MKIILKYQILQAILILTQWKDFYGFLKAFSILLINTSSMGFHIIKNKSMQHFNNTEVANHLYLILMSNIALLIA